jgi:hypothetical protein
MTSDETTKKTDKPKFFEIRMAYFYCACGAQINYHMDEDSTAPRKGCDHPQCPNCKQEYEYDFDRKGFVQVTPGRTPDVTE